MPTKKKQSSQKNKRMASKRQLEPEALQESVVEKSTNNKKRKVEEKPEMVAAKVMPEGKPGVVLVCGCGDAGQLGLGNQVMEKFLPTVLSNLPASIVALAAGGMHSLLLTDDGQVYSFGCNDDGALGRPSSDETDCLPELVKIQDKEGKPQKIVQISAGDSHSAALTSTGKVYAWGVFRDANGVMGLKSTLPNNWLLHEPVLMVDSPKMVVTAIASGDNHLVCLTSLGEVLTCGCAEQGQLGRVPLRSCSLRDSRQGPPSLLELQPITPPRNQKVTHIWAGSFCTLLRTNKGLIFGCGLNNYNQLGELDHKQSGEVLSHFHFQVLNSFKNEEWKDIAGGPHHSLGLTEEGEVRVLGRKEYGRLGLGADCDDKASPVPLPALKGKVAIDISSGVASSFAVTSEGEVYSWGQAASNLGLGDIDDDALEPTLVKSKSLATHRVVRVSAGGQHTLFLAYAKS